MKYSVQCTWWFLLADCYMYFWQPQKLHDYLFCYKFRSLLRPFLIFVYNFVLECFFYIGISFPVLLGVAALHFSLFLQVLAFARGTEIYFYQVMVFEIACMCLHSKILSFQGSFYKRNSRYRTFWYGLRTPNEAIHAITLSSLTCLPQWYTKPWVCPWVLLITISMQCMWWLSIIDSFEKTHYFCFSKLKIQILETGFLVAFLVFNLNDEF